MTVSGIINASQNILARTDSGTMSFLNDAAVNKTLNMGEIIKGKVLRHIEGNQYSVKIGGQERVVDSANPLRTNETLYGRVVGLGDKVHFVRTNSTSEQPSQPLQSENYAGSSKSTNAQLIEKIFAQFYQPLDKNSRQVLLRAVNTATNKEAMVISGLLAQKLGLKVSQESLQATYTKLSNNEKLLQEVRATVINLDLVGTASFLEKPDSTVFKDVSYLLQKISEFDRYSARSADDSEAELDDGNSLSNNIAEKFDDRQQSASQQQQHWDLGRWILNSQSDGSVSHKFLNIPIYLAGQIVEVNLALFSQRDSYINEDGLRYRKLVFSLDTDHLGQINIDALVANKNVSISIRAESESAVEYLASFIKPLKASLQDTAWTVDSIRYSVQAKNDSNLPLLAVVEHHITENSVNHLG